MKLVFLGPPGAGKGTQAKRLAQAHAWAHISTGDILREAAAEGTGLGLEAKAIMDRGELVPDEVMVPLIRERLARDDCRDGFILDGFPRTRPQAQALDALLAEIGWTLDGVVYFDVNDEEVVRRNEARLTCADCGAVYNTIAQAPRVAGRCDHCSGELERRVDDMGETILRRTGVFREKTAAVRHYYASAGKLRKVEAVGEIEVIARRVEEAIVG